MTYWWVLGLFCLAWPTFDLTVWPACRWLLVLDLNESSLSETDLVGCVQKNQYSMSDIS